MDNKDVFRILTNAADFVNDHDSLALIESLRIKADNRDYVIPVIGQFSAGKSKMINRLLERDVLPVKITETTAVPTYISYADQESAVIEYVDGRHEQIDVSFVKEWWNKPMDSKDPVKSIHVFLPSSILAGGITFVDTPGVNTLIDRHVKMTEEILQSSIYVIYVLAGQVSDYDNSMINRIREAGITMVFARTHADNLKSQERSIPETIASEKRLLGDPDDFFIMCNDREQKKAYDNWQHSFEQFRSFVLDLSDRIAPIFSLAINARLEPVRLQLESRLNARMDEIDSASKLTVEELKRELESIESAVKKLEESLKAKEDKMNLEIDAVKSKCANELLSLSNNSYSHFAKELQKISNVQYEDVVSDCFTTSMGEYIDDVSKVVDRIISDWEKKNVEETKESLRGVDLSDIRVDNDFIEGFDEDSIRLYEEKEDALVTAFQERLYAIQELSNKTKEELAMLGIDQESFKKMLDELVVNLKQQNVELKQLQEDYTPRYFIKESIWGKRLKRVGDIADIAMLLVPGPSWANAGAKCAAKGAQLASKGSKIAKVGGKVVKGAGKVANTMAKADKILDAAKIAKGASQVIVKKGDKETARTVADIEQINKKLAERGKGNILDYLSLSYWFEKAGEAIDPTHSEIDQDYQDEYDMMAASYHEQIGRINKDLQNTRHEMNSNDRDIEKLKFKVDSLNKERQRLSEKFEEDKQRIQDQKALCIRKQYFARAKDAFKKRTDDYRELAQERVENTMAENVRILVEAAREYISGKIEDKRVAINEVLSRQASTVTEHDETINKLRELITSLDSISN